MVDAVRSLSDFQAHLDSNPGYAFPRSTVLQSQLARDLLISLPLLTGGPLIVVATPVTQITIQAAVDSAAALYPNQMTRIAVPGGQGAITPTVATSPAVRIRNGNIFLDVGEGTTFVAYPGSAQHSWFLNQPSTLTVGGASLLTANINRYADTVTIGAGVQAGWVEGDMIQLQQVEYAAGQADGFFVSRIFDKPSGTTFRLYDPAPQAFTTARTAVAVKLVLASNIIFRGVKGTGAGNTHNNTAFIGGNNVKDVRLIDCGGSYFKGGAFAFGVAGYNITYYDCDGDYSGFDDHLGNQLAAFGNTNVTHLTRVNCHANFSPGEGFLDWSCSYVTAINDSAVGNYNRGIESHNVWLSEYIGGNYSGSTANVGIDFNGNSFGIYYNNCRAVGNAFGNFTAIDAGLVPDNIWANNCNFSGTPSVAQTTADLVFSAGATNIHVINCDYLGIIDGSSGADIMPPRAGISGLLFIGTALKTHTGTLVETSILPATFVGPGLSTAIDFFNKPRNLRVILKGVWTTAGPNSCNFKFKTGAGTVMCTTGAVTPSGALTDAYFEIVIELNVFTPGTLANVTCFGKLVIIDTGVSNAFHMVNAVAPQINTQAAQTFDITAILGNVGDSLTIASVTAEVLN